MNVKRNDDLGWSAEHDHPEKVETDTETLLPSILVHGVAHPCARAVRDFLFERGKYFVQPRKVGNCIESSAARVQNGHYDHE